MPFTMSIKSPFLYVYIVFEAGNPHIFAQNDPNQCLFSEHQWCSLVTRTPLYMGPVQQYSDGSVAESLNLR